MYVQYVNNTLKQNVLPDHYANRGFCSNVVPSDHAHILHTGVFEGEEFNKKRFRAQITKRSKVIDY